MRQKFTMCPSFSANIPCVQSIVSEYHKKYRQISTILDKNPSILDAFHGDLVEFGSSGGRECTFSSEQVLRMFIIKTIECFTWRELIIRVSESDFLRNFAQIGVGKLMTHSFLCAASKNITAQTYQTINDILLKYAKHGGKTTSDTLRVDSTVAESNIHYPTDSSLLWDSYRVGSRLLGRYRDLDMRCFSYRFHVKKIKKLHTFISTHVGKKSKSTQKQVAKSKKILIERVNELNGKMGEFISESTGWSLTDEQAILRNEIVELLIKTKHVVAQATRALSGETVPAKERIFSIFEEHSELLMRGKANKPSEFGHMVTIAQTKEKFISYYNVEESSRHDSAMTEIVLNAHKKAFGVYPAKFTADKNYYKSMDIVDEWEKKIDVFSVGKKGKRSELETVREHSESFRDMQKFRAGCEGSISVLKRGFGLKRLLSRSFKSFSAWVGAIIFCHNLVNLAGP